MPRKQLTTEDFIRKAHEVHGDKYDYSETVFVDSKTKVRIICPIHGPFEQAPYSHLQGVGCMACGSEKTKKSKVKWDEKTFIAKACEVHGDKYDYSKLGFVNMRTPVTIICPIHGEFVQQPRVHILGSGCPKCVGKNVSFEDFLTKSVAESELGF